MEICSSMPHYANSSSCEVDSIALLRRIGTHIGARIGSRLTEGSSPFLEAKDAVKFVCKDMWYYLYRQQATRLQANRKGVFVIHDSTFPPLQTIAKCCIPSVSPLMSNVPIDTSVGPLMHPKLVTASSLQLQEETSPASSSSKKTAAGKLDVMDAVQFRAFEYLALNAGVIEGFLGSAGFACTVETTIGSQLPACAFQISLRQTSSEILNPSRLLGTVPGVETASI